MHSVSLGFLSDRAVCVGQPHAVSILKEIATRLLASSCVINSLGVRVSIRPSIHQHLRRDHDG